MEQRGDVTQLLELVRPATLDVELVETRGTAGNRRYSRATSVSAMPEPPNSWG